MKTSSLTHEAVLEAMNVFDQEVRDTPGWKEWTENKAHKYAIEHYRQLYPVKKIVSLASNVPVSEFSGGRDSGQANQLVQRAGFKIVNLHPTNPDWSRDELILALNFYLTYRRNPPRKDSNEILDLSALLNRLGEKLFSPEERADTFRNVNSVYMKLMNFRRLDPQFTAQGRKGLQRGAKAEEEVWAEFANDPARCQQVAAAIIASLDDPETEMAWIEGADGGIEDAPEGRLLTRMAAEGSSDTRIIYPRFGQINPHNQGVRSACCDRVAVTRAPGTPPNTRHEWREPTGCRDLSYDEQEWVLIAAKQTGAYPIDSISLLDDVHQGFRRAKQGRDLPPTSDRFGGVAPMLQGVLITLRCAGRDSPVHPAAAVHHCR